MGKKKNEKTYEVPMVAEYDYEKVEQLKEATFKDIENDEKTLIESCLKRLGLSLDEKGVLPDSIEFERTITAEYVTELQSSSVYKVSWKIKKPAVSTPVDATKKTKESDVELATRKLEELKQES